MKPGDHWLIGAGIIVLILLVLYNGGVFAQTDIQGAAQDADEATRYLWEFAAFFSILGISRITQWLKQRRFFPRWSWLTEVKESDGYCYTKLRVFWIRSFNYIGSALLITYCLLQRYGHDHIQQIMVAVLIIEMNAAIVIEGGLSILHARYPEAAKVARDGLYISDDDCTIMSRVTQIAFTGGGKEKRVTKRPVVDNDSLDYEKTVVDPKS